MKQICFDMDGTIADLYAVNDWLEKLRADDPTPYREAEPMLNMANFARLLHKAQRLNYEIVIISWLSIMANAAYAQAITEAKKFWLKKHLPSVTWDKILIVPHGTPKHELADGFLFDDEEENRKQWGVGALPPDEIINFLKNL